MLGEARSAFEVLRGHPPANEILGKLSVSSETAHGISVALCHEEREGGCFVSSGRPDLNRRPHAR